jgi:hypothetical protein
MQFPINLWMVGLWWSHIQTKTHKFPLNSKHGALKCWLDIWGSRVNKLIGWRSTTITKHYTHTPKMKQCEFIKNKVLECIIKTSVKWGALILTPMLAMKLLTWLKHAMHGWCKVHIIRMWSTNFHSLSHIMCVACVNGHCMETYANTRWQCFLHVLISHHKWLFIIVGNGMDLCRNPSFGLATKARGCKVAGVKRKEARESKGRKPGSKCKGIGRVRAKRKPGSQRKCEGVWGSEHSHSQGNSHFGRGSPGGLPKLQSACWRVKSQWFVTLFIPLERSWNVDV